MKALVILYNSQICNAITLNSLASFAPRLARLGLVEVLIWNNGPSSLALESDCYQTLAPLVNSGIAIDIQECLANAPLSHIYNRYICSHDYSLIFDDDTCLSVLYVEALATFLSSNAQIFIPLIYADNAIFYPYLNSHLATDKQQGSLFIGEVASISSGICLSPSVINSLQIRYNDLFDSRFNFYGVDTTFFLRVTNSKINSYYVGGRLDHHLSRASENHAAITQFRYEERLYDIVLQMRHYFSLKTNKYFMIFIYRYTLTKFIENFALALRVFFGGRHPRTNRQYVSQAIALNLEKFDHKKSIDTNIDNTNIGF